MSETMIQAVNYTKGRHSKIRASVIHTMQAPEKPSTAEAVARWFGGQAGPAPRASAHWCHDNDSSVRCVADKDTAWAAPGLNDDGIQHECAGFAEQVPTEWRDPFSDALLHRVARQVARDCINYSLPAIWLSVQDLLAGRKGITSHANVSKAYKRSSHWDPGPNFPVDYFISLVVSYMRGKDAPRVPPHLVWKADGRNPDGSAYNEGAVKFLQFCANEYLRSVKVGDRKPLVLSGKYDGRTAARIKEIENSINDILWAGGMRKGFLQADGVTTDKTCEYLGNMLKLFSLPAVA